MLPGMSVEHPRRLLARRLAAPRHTARVRQAGPRASLRRLAEAAGIQTSYLDVNGRPVRASSETLQKLFDALGAEAQNPQTEAAKILEPVTVAWEGRPWTVRLRLPK